MGFNSVFKGLITLLVGYDWAMHDQSLLIMNGKCSSTDWVRGEASYWLRLKMHDKLRYGSRRISRHWSHGSSGYWSPDNSFRWSWVLSPRHSYHISFHNTFRVGCLSKCTRHMFCLPYRDSQNARNALTVLSHVVTRISKLHCLPIDRQPIGLFV